MSTDCIMLIVTEYSNYTLLWGYRVGAEAKRPRLTYGILWYIFLGESRYISIQI